MRFQTTRFFVLTLLSLLLAGLAVPRLAMADKIRKIPVLVNWEGFAEKPHSIDDPDKDPTFSAEALADAKGRLTRAIDDANKVLQQCKSAVSNSLRLLNIQHQNQPSGISSPVSMEGKADDFDKGAKTAKMELSKTFKKETGKGKQQKGQKIFMVQELPGDDEGSDTLGKGRVGEPVMWINVNSLFEPIGQLPGEDPVRIPVAGPIIVHELLHNAGLDEHTTEDGNVFQESIDLFKSGMNPNAVVDRGLTKAQCGKLDEHFKKYGLSAPNVEQKVGFLPSGEGLEEKTHYAVVTNPSPEDLTVANLAIIEYSITGDNLLTGRLSWDTNLASSPLNAILFVTLEELNTFVDISLLGEGDGQVFAQATSIIGDESGPVENLRFTATDPSHLSSSFLDFEIQLPGTPAGSLAIETFIFDATSNQELFFPAQLELVEPAPALIGLPVAAMPGETIEFSGERFLPQEEVSLFIDAAEVGQALVDDSLSFNASIIVPDLAAGDYLIEAVDSSGAFAIGVLTVVPEPSSIVLFALGMVLLFVRQYRTR